MQNLKDKIKNTALFTPQEKIELLATIDTLSLEDVKQLESVIDEYDVKYKEISQKFKQNVVTELDTLEQNVSPEKKQSIQQASSKIKSGLDMMFPS